MVLSTSSDGSVDDGDVEDDDEVYVDLGGLRVKQVSQMPLLGAIISSNGDTGDDFDNRISKATGAFYADKQELCCECVSIYAR
eukprot:12354859-Karenia_brevis.AAC.1